MPTVELLQLPVPGQTLGPDREIQVEEFLMQVYSTIKPGSLTKLSYLSTRRVTISILKDRLFAYGCPISGSRSQLVERLREFSADRDHWVTCVHKISG